MPRRHPRQIAGFLHGRFVITSYSIHYTKLYDAVEALVEALEAGRIDAITFTSQAQVERIHRLAADRNIVNALRVGLERTCVAAIGPVA